MGFVSCSKSAADDAATLAAANEYTDDKLAAGVAPSGAAGGDLSGSYPSPTLKAAAVVDAVEAGIAADTGAQAAIAAAIADDIVGTGAFQAALAAAAPNLKTCAGAAMASGANVPTCSEMNAAIAAGVASATIPDATDTVKGKVELATTAEATAGTSTSLAVTPAGLAANNDALVATTAQAQAWTDNEKLLSPLRLADAFKGSNVSLTSNGYQKLPSGLIIQWGQSILATTPSVTLGALALPIAFPNVNLLGICQTNDVNSNGTGCRARAESGTTTQFRFNHAAPSSFSTTLRWFAIGY